MTGKQFSWSVRVYWEDTDGGGVVYYANYLRFLERARTEWLRSLGFVQTQLAKNPGIMFVVASMNIEYRRPARLDDSLTIVCTCEPEGGACLRFDQSILRDEELLATASVRVACLDAATFRPKRLPAAIVEALSSVPAEGEARPEACEGADLK